MPGIAADGFEKVVEEQVYARALQAEKLSGREACVAAHRAILGKTTMFSPQLLLSAGAVLHQSKGFSLQESTCSLMTGCHVLQLLVASSTPHRPT